MKVLLIFIIYKVICRDEEFFFLENIINILCLFWLFGVWFFIWGIVCGVFWVFWWGIFVVWFKLEKIEKVIKFLLE